VDPDAVWDGEWVGGGIGVLDGLLIVEGEGTVLVVKLGRAIVTNGDFLAQLCESDALSSNDFGEDLLFLLRFGYFYEVL